MDEELKKAVTEIGELVKTLPPSVQEKAFEMLLTYRLGDKERQRKPLATAEEDAPGGSRGGAEAAVQSRAGQDLLPTDLHLKAKKFLEKQGLSIGDLNQLFYKEQGEIKPLFEDLHTTRASESQIRLGLLSALKTAILTGEFEFSGEDVREQCQVRKTYDATNFKANFKNNKRLFDQFQSYNKTDPMIRLSEEGRAELAKLIKELQ